LGTALADRKEGSEESGEQVTVILGVRDMGRERSRVKTCFRNDLAYKTFRWKGEDWTE